MTKMLPDRRAWTRGIRQARGGCKPVAAQGGITSGAVAGRAFEPKETGLEQYFRRAWCGV